MLTDISWNKNLRTILWPLAFIVFLNRISLSHRRSILTTKGSILFHSRFLKAFFKQLWYFYSMGRRRETLSESGFSSLKQVGSLSRMWPDSCRFRFVSFDCQAFRRFSKINHQFQRSSTNSFMVITMNARAVSMMNLVDLLALLSSSWFLHCFVFFSAITKEFKSKRWHAMLI